MYDYIIRKGNDASGVNQEEGVEIATAYFLLPLGDISPENIAESFGSNVLSIGILSAVGTVLSVGFLGSLYLAFNSKSSASELEPMSALLAGVQKFFPLFGAYFLSIFYPLSSLHTFNY